MTGDEFDARMRAFEYFHDLRLLPDAWIVVRVDGRTQRVELPSRGCSGTSSAARTPCSSTATSPASGRPATSART